VVARWMDELGNASFIAVMAQAFPIDLAVTVGHPAMIASGPFSDHAVERVRNGKECKNLQFSTVAATFEKASTYVFAGRLIRNAEVRGSIPLCSTIYFQRFTAADTGGCFFQLANTWTFFLEFNCF
jgi:hypothetical protein